MDHIWVVEGAVVPCSWPILFLALNLQEKRAEKIGGGEIPTIVPKFTGSIFMTEYYG